MRRLLVGDLVEVLAPNPLAGLVARVIHVFPALLPNMPNPERCYKLSGNWVLQERDLAVFNDRRAVDVAARFYAFPVIAEERHAFSSETVHSKYAPA